MQPNIMHLVKTQWIWSRNVPVFGQGRDSGGDNQAQSVHEQEMVYQAFIAEYHLFSQGFFGDEAGKSTRSENRAALQRLSKIIEATFPRIDNLYARERLTEPKAVVMVWNFDRLSRDPGYSAWIRADWALRGVVVLELTEPPPTSNGLVDDIMFRVKREGDRQLLAKISINAKRGQVLNQAVQDTDPEFRKFNPDWPTADGGYIGIADGKPPVGFRGEKLRIGTKTRERKDGNNGIETTPRIVQRLVPDDATWVRCYQTWLMRHEGHSITTIHRATHLYKTDKSYAHFFANRIYTGDYEHGGVLYQNFVPALIPRAWFDEEQERRRQRTKKPKGEAMPPELEPRRVPSASLLSGKVQCETVPGQPHSMHAHRSRATAHRTPWNAYECFVHKHSGKQVCPFYGVSQPALDKSVVDVILRDVITRDNLRPLVEKLNSHLDSKQSTYTAELNSLKEQIAEAERQRKRYDDMIEADKRERDGEPIQSLVDKLWKYETLKADLLAGKRQLEASGPRAIGAQVISDAQLDEYITHVRDVLLGGDPMLARRILDHFVVHVSVRKGSKMGMLYYTFPVDSFFAPDLSPLRTPSLEGFRVRAEY